MQYVRHYSEAAKRFSEVINMGTMGCKQLRRQTVEDKGAFERAGQGGEHDENYTSILFSCLLFSCVCHSRHCACVCMCVCQGCGHPSRTEGTKTDTARVSCMRRVQG